VANQNHEDKTLATINVTNKTALRLPQATIDRIRVISRKKSEKADRDVPWSVVGRQLLEQALREEERRAQPELVPLA